MARASAVYADVVFPYPDAKVAFEICHRGPISYKLHGGCGVGNYWISANVTPHIAEAFGRNVAGTLGRALLWACFDPEARESVDIRLRERIIHSYTNQVCINATVVANADGELPNPIQKYRLALFESNGAAVITEVAPVAAAAVEPNATTNAANPVPPPGAREVVTIRPTQQHDHVIMKV